MSELTTSEIVVEIMTIEVEQANSYEEIIIEQDSIEVISDTEQGIPGPKGDDGEPSYISVEANGAIGGHRVVKIFDGFAEYASNIDNYSGKLGLTTSAVENEEVFNAYISGVITEPTWNFTEGNVYLSSNGLLTQTFPMSGSIIIVGNAVSPTSLSINFQTICRRN